MNILNQALINLSNFLNENNISYMVIGGMANAVWGNPRATLDIDVTIWVTEMEIEHLLPAFVTKFKPLVETPLEFILKTRVLPVVDKENVRVDIIFGALPFEQEAIERAIDVSVSGKKVKFCSPEDLILLKIISKRQKDLDDVHGIVKNQHKNLDLSYLEPRVNELSLLLENPDIQGFWKKCKKIMEI